MGQPVIIGFHCSHEQYAPSHLLRHVKRAAAAGFDAAMCSDHFQPWSERQGHSGFAWSWLAAALESTRLSFGTVCAPGQRYHPAVVAQASATLADMYPDRFWLAIGSGEALNETITSDPWPPKAHRNERLEQAAHAIRELWAGRTVSVDARVRIATARLYSTPRRAPLLLAAALTPETAQWAASWSDGLITAAGPRGAMQQIVDAYRTNGGGDKPLFLQVALSYAATEQEAIAAAHDQWRHCVLPADRLATLTTPAEFDRACANATPADVAERIRTSSEIERHIEWLQRDVELGFERVYLHNVARAHQDRFIDECGARLLPAFRQLA